MEKFLTTVLEAALKILICSLAVWFLWNGFMDVKFGLPQISFGEAVILCVIGGFITGN